MNISHINTTARQIIAAGALKRRGTVMPRIDYIARGEKEPIGWLGILNALPYALGFWLVVWALMEVL